MSVIDRDFQIDVSISQSPCQEFYSLEQTATLANGAELPAFMEFVEDQQVIEIYTPEPKDIGNYDVKVVAELDDP